MNKILILLFLLSLTINSALSFDKLGHRIVGKIAHMNLTKSSKVKLKRLIGDRTLDEISNWPDEIKSDPLLSRPQNTWHYINIKGNDYKELNPEATYEVYFKTYPKMSYEQIQKKMKPDLSDIKGNLVWGIKTFTKILMNKKKTKAQRVEAVKFLVHFMGDLHQPLHCGYAHDRGGNDVKVVWNGKKTNLHAIWDSDMLAMKKLSHSEYVRYIYKPKEINKKNYMAGNLMDWVKESMSKRDSLYDLVKKKRYEGKYKEYKYHYDFVKLLDEGLVKAGLRLAKILNNSL